MAKRHQPEPDAPPVLNRRLACPLCGGRRACSLAEVVRYDQGGWPRCCGEVMALSTAPPDDAAGGEGARGATHQE